MKNHLLRNLIFCSAVFLLGACVSVKIPTGTGTPAKDVKYTDPGKPYEDIKVSSADKAWLSAKTGNTISFISDCNGTADPTLQQLEGEPLAVLDKLKILKSDNVTFNGREALHTQAQGEVDGVPVKTELVVFKKNNCNYTLSYGGLLKNFDDEAKVFDKFKESFKAP
ncbi:hypothetical protein [Bdellovibrio sp. HCB337]|uniref:hypothetical protein n=1 Tax=Bdellovibrio sp. HCB337 TaxID=3394358 RepID=UPI0039A74CB6